MRIFHSIFLAFFVFCFSSECLADTSHIRLKRPTVLHSQSQRLYFETHVYAEFDALGNISFLNVYKSSGNALWDAEALDIVRRARHHPLRNQLGRPIEGWRIIIVDNNGK